MSGGEVVGTLCEKCGTGGPPNGKFCFACGSRMVPTTDAVAFDAAPKADKVEQHHRSHWTPKIANPTARQFVPPPRARYDPPPVIPAPEDVPEPIAPPAQWPPENYLCNVLDRASNPRAAILQDGECRSVTGQTLGYINLDSLECGSVDGDYWGCVDLRSDEEHREIKDKDDLLVGSVDCGRARVLDNTDSTIGEISNTGECTGHAGTFIGKFETSGSGWAFRNLPVLGLYLLIIDVGMYDEVEG